MLLFQGYGILYRTLMPSLSARVQVKSKELRAAGGLLLEPADSTSIRVGTE